MNFASDNWAGVTEQVSAGLAGAAGGLEAAYGNDTLTRSVSERFSELFETDVAVFFTATGSAANSLALSAYMKPSGVVVCHRDSHINTDECGAPEFLTNGAKLLPLDGHEGRLDAASVARTLEVYGPNNLRGGRAVAASITQMTEVGTLYRRDEIAAIGAATRAADVRLHMDGARFANALVGLNSSPADITWRAGVDVLSFGGTKNGCWCAEAVVFFNPAHAEDFDFYRARSGHRFSKARFVAAQFQAYLADGHWLDTARRANNMARRLADGLERSSQARLAWPIGGNEVFAVFTRETAARLKAAGAMFYEWPAGHDSLEQPLSPDEAVHRLVASFVTTEADVDGFLQALDAA
ncbi:MAG: beta-eliminating lyase-related protein [Pseudomonadota bacterium]